MKSFADWTDEIRALMNPPAPVVDTCNWGEVKWLAPTKSLSQEEFRKQYEAEWAVQRPGGIDPSMFKGIDPERYIGQPTRGESIYVASGRRCGKSNMARWINKYYEEMADSVAGTQWDKAYMDMVLTGTGRAEIVIFDEESKVDPLAFDIDLGWATLTVEE